MNSADRFTITETEPTPLICDFQSFLDYIAANIPYLTPKGYVSGKDLFQINKGMTHPIGETRPYRSGQQLYPELHLFFHLAQAGRLIQKAPGKGDKTVQQLTDRMTDYSKLFYRTAFPGRMRSSHPLMKNEGPHADEVEIGELGLAKGQTILYLFDYGDEWRFSVTLEEIQQDKPHPKKPRIEPTPWA